MDRKPVLSIAPGRPGRLRRPEHVSLDLHRGEHPAHRADHCKGRAHPDPRGSVGVSALVVIVTFNIKLAAFHVLGAAGIGMASERLSRYRKVAVSLRGGAMIVVGLVLVKEAAAPLAGQP